MFRIGGWIAVFAASLAFSAPANAGERLRVTADRDYGRNYTTGVDRLGVFVANRPGGLYMGRLMVGDTFVATGAEYKSRTRGAYFRAQVSGEAGLCGWVGPSGRVHDVAAWAAADGAGDADCDRGALRWLGTADRLSFNDGSALYSDVNCPPPSTFGSTSLATFGGYTYTTRETPVYYNLDWRWDGARYDAAAPRTRVGTVPAGTGVFYRYTANGGAFSNVFFDGNSGSYGWSFIDAAAVPRVKYWSPASDPPNYRAFNCDSREAPAFTVIPPWQLWLSLGGATFGVGAA
ncbi:MAG: hypothetical protein ACRDKI_08045 [Solirubrobacterales bacterium]